MSTELHRQQGAVCKLTENRTADKRQQTGNLEENNLCELEMKGKGGCWFHSYLACSLPLSGMQHFAVCIHLQNQRGSRGEDRFETKFCKIPENRITSARDAHWGSGVCFFP